MKRMLRTLGLLAILMTAGNPALAYYQSCQLYVLVQGGTARCWERCDIYTDEGDHYGRLMRFYECE